MILRVAPDAEPVASKLKGRSVPGPAITVSFGLILACSFHLLDRRAPEATQIGRWCIASGAVLVHSLSGALAVYLTWSIAFFNSIIFCAQNFE
jgi:hypothetical protein